jgi:hypothetical protein
LDAAIEAAVQQGLTPEQISYIVLSRAKVLAAQTPRASPTVCAAIFECNPERLFYYANVLREALTIVTRPYLIASLDEKTAPADLAEVDFVITSFFHLVDVRRKIRRIPELKHLEIYAVVVRPHLDVLRKLAELPHGSRLGILYFEGPYYTETRLRAMVEHIKQANLKNIRQVVPIYVQGEPQPGDLNGLDAVLVRPENLADTQKYLDLNIPIIEYHNVIDQASVAMLREVVRGIREDKMAAITPAPTEVSEGTLIWSDEHGTPI